MFAKINHVAIVSDNYAELAKNVSETAPALALAATQHALDGIGQLGPEVGA